MKSDKHCSCFVILFRGHKISTLVDQQETVMNKLSTSKVWEIVGKISESKTLKSVCVISGCLAVRQAFWYLYHKYYHLPHGPIGLPFIGSLIQLSLQSHSYLTWINMKYGNIASAYLGNARIVMINDPGLYKQIGSKKEFEHRPFKEKKNHRVVRHVRPLPFINGPEWKIRRKNFFKAMTEMYVYVSVTDTLIHKLDVNVNFCCFVF